MGARQCNGVQWSNGSTVKIINSDLRLGIASTTVIVLVSD